MSGLPWLLARVASETETHHSSADEDRLAAIELKSFREYRMFLSRIYGFEATVEHAICGVKGLAAGVMKHRLRAARLRHDLQVLGLSERAVGELSVPRGIQLHSPAGALGWLYVLERNTLLSGLLHRNLCRALGEPSRDVFSYLSAYGEQRGAQLRDLGEAIRSCVASGGALSSVVAAAHDGFRAQRQWYRAKPSALGPFAAPATEVTCVRGCDEL